MRRPDHRLRLRLRLSRGVLAGGAALIAIGASALALPATDSVPVPVAFSAQAVRGCVPAHLNASAVLPGTSVAASPLPGSLDASPQTQISLLGAPPSALLGVRVRGSITGAHGGRLRPYSEGDGASFVPSSGFRAGETVTVRGAVVQAGRSQRFSFSFGIAHEDSLPYVRSYHAIRDPNEKQHFQSAPALEAPVVVITAHSPQSASGDIFSAPYSGPGPSGPMIFDEAGNLVWFHPLPPATEATNLQVQQLNGTPVLTWWQGYIPPQGFGEGEEVIANSSYHELAHVHAGNGYTADLHDFHITPQGTGLLTVFDPVYCDLSPVGGSRTDAVTDTAFQEIDLATGLVRREWHGLDHLPIADSYASARGSSSSWPFDFFHLNSVDQIAGGTTLISARNTWAMYELSTVTGQVLRRLGGRHSDLHLAAGAATAYQHDATVQANGTISVFDNGAVPKVHSQSRALVLSVDPHAHTESVVAQYEHSTPLSSASQGNVQVLDDGNAFIGWGSYPFFSEFSSSGRLLFDAHLHGSYESYRAYRFPWTGAPGYPPSIAASRSVAGVPEAVYASWNGDNRTASWQVLAGASPASLVPIATSARSGFQTTISLTSAEPYLAVRALDSSGSVLGTSATISG